VRAAVLAAALVGAGACYGEIHGPGVPVDPDGPRGICADGDADVAGPRLLRRLTSHELTASVRATFGLDPAEWAGPAVPADAAAQNGFTNNVDRLRVDEAYARGLLATAEAVAQAVVQPATLARVLPCAATGDAACAQRYLDTVGRRLYRRPLTDEERGRYLALHAELAGDGFASWVRWATVALLQSPHFLYRSELGDPDGDGYRLTGYEVATALAFALTGAPPTDALLDRAGAGGLDTAEGLAAAARELALDPATGAARPGLREVIFAFADQWLGLSKLPNLLKSPESFPGFTPDVRDAMSREIRGFLAHVLFDEGGGVAELLTSPVSVVDPVLAGYYGWGGGPGAVARPEGWGIGLLAQGSLLTIRAGNQHTSPTQRGLVVRERLLCSDMPAPPPIVGDLPPATGGETTRDRYQEHAENPACAGCHQYMDPIGFAFEHLDATGRYRASEGPFPIDARGAIVGLGEDLPIDGPRELAEALAGLPETAVCVGSFLASHAYGLDHHDTSCLVTSLGEALAAGELGLVDFYVALATTRHFTRRTD
jgi:hypothetical protein